MHVLLINLEKGWRGGERQTLLTALGLKDAGHEPAVLARKKGALAQRLKEEEITVIEKKSSFAAILYLLFHTKKYSIYHAQTSAALTWLASLKWHLKKKGKIVFTRRTAFPLQGSSNEDGAPIETCGNKRLQRLLWKWQQADAFVAISQAAAADPQALGIEPTIIPSAVDYVPADVAHIISYTDTHGLSGIYVLGTSAALSKEKDPCTTIRAIHTLWQKRQDFVFLHFGADGDAKEEAVALVKELGLEDVYRFMGFESRIEDMYRLLHVFVLSSKFEALGSSVLDAFLDAAPVVATQAGGLAELLADGRGIACEIGDFEAIAAGCDRLMEDKELCNAQVLKALKWVQQHYDVNTMVQKYIEVYNRF